MGGQSDVGEGSCDDVKPESGGLHVATGPYKCDFDGCQASFKKPSRLKQHICSHTGERPFKCDRPNCDKAYTHACHLKRHIAKSHQPQPYKKTFKCPHPGCELCLSHEFNLKRHFRRKHEKIFTCTKCRKKFLKNHLLRAHMYSHDGVSLFRCEECEASFDTAGNLRRHQRCHKKHTCNIQGCRESFLRWSEMMRHIKEAHPREFICDLCGQKYRTKGNLVQHVRTHMKDRPTFRCPYPECSRSYSRDIYLQNHIKWIHKGLGGHKCTFDSCGRILSTKAKLVKHLAWHERDNRAATKKPTGASRKARWDKGIPRRSMAVVLSGIPPLPLPLEKKIIDGVPLDVNDVTIRALTGLEDGPSEAGEPQSASEKISSGDAKATVQLQVSS